MASINGYEIYRHDCRRWAALRRGVGGMLFKSERAAIAWARKQNAGDAA